MRVSHKNLINKVDEVIEEGYIIKDGRWEFDIQKVSATDMQEVIGLMILNDDGRCCDSLIGDENGGRAVYLLGKLMACSMDDEMEDLLDELKKNAQFSYKNRFESLIKERLEYLEWQANESMCNDWDDVA
jgi:hypothetical protein